MNSTSWIVVAHATLLAVAFYVVTPEYVDAQSQEASPRLAVSAGLGNTFGGLGATVEAFLAEARVSIVGGAGWVPSGFGFGDAGGHASYALALRGFLGKSRLRGYAEAAWSSYGRTTTHDGIFGEAVDSEIHYGLGLSGGLHVLIPGGFSMIAGLGKFTSTEQPGETGTVLNVGLGLTFPR